MGFRSQKPSCGSKTQNSDMRSSISLSESQAMTTDHHHGHPSVTDRSASPTTVIKIIIDHSVVAADDPGTTTLGLVLVAAQQGPSASILGRRVIVQGSSFDHVIDPGAQQSWNGQVERLSRFAIDYQFELGRKLHRQVTPPRRRRVCEPHSRRLDDIGSQGLARNSSDLHPQRTPAMDRSQATDSELQAL
jgi:hypothetical protein